MKKFLGKMLGLVLGVLIALGVRYGVSYAGDFIDGLGMDKKIDALAGVWHCMEDGQEDVQDLLDLVDLYEEEKALVRSDLTFQFVKIVEFTQAQTYRFSYDVELTKQQVRDMYETAIEDLFENRAALTEVYGEELAGYTREQFRQFYAELYSMASYDELLDTFADNAYDYDKLGEDFETGTYTIKGDDIMCTITGQSQAEALGYDLEGGNLTLTYTNLVEYYTRAN